MAANPSRLRLLVIVGPTASGKSELAYLVAKEFDGEIISADSWTVYRGFNIGTAKPSLIEQKSIRHHLLDVTEAKDGFNASLFKDLAHAAIIDIQSRGKLPIMAGGTGLYIDSVVFDFDFLPASNSRQRAKLNKLSLDELLQEAKKRKIDLKGLDIRNKRRIIRAIESSGRVPSKKSIQDGVMIIGIRPPKEVLRRKIEARVERMIKRGLEKEVKRLSQRYGWEIEPMKGIGYREWKDYFEARQSPLQTKQRIIASSMGLAKRQYTWLKRNPHIRWFDDIEQARRYLKIALNT